MTRGCFRRKLATRGLVEGEALGDFELAADGRFLRWKAAGGISGKQPLRRINDRLSRNCVVMHTCLPFR